MTLTRDDFKFRNSSDYPEVVATCPILSKRVDACRAQFSSGIHKMLAVEFGQMIMKGQNPYKEKACFENDPSFEEVPELTFEDKLKALAKKLENETQERFVDDDMMRIAAFECNYKVTIKPGRKYTKLDVGGSGKYMVENDTGKIFGIKGYGVIHRGYKYGTVDTIDDYFWGGYTATLKNAKRGVVAHG